MKTIQERLEELTKKISSDEFQKSYGLGNEVDNHIFDYDPEDEYVIREYIKYISEKQNLKIRVIDVYEVIIEILKEKGFLEKTFEYEEKKGTKYICDIIGKTLGICTSNDLMIKKIVDMIKEDETVVLCGLGKVYSIVRGHTILNNLNNFINNKILMFYPGKYDDSGLKLFNVLENSNYYRAFKIVGRK